MYLFLSKNKKLKLPKRYDDFTVKYFVSISIKKVMPKSETDFTIAFAYFCSYGEGIIIGV